MKLIKMFLPIFLLGIFLTSCSKDDDVSEPEVEETENFEIEEFIYSGMNEIYLYKADVPELADNYFTNTTEKQDFFKKFNSPEDLYEGIQSSDDRFSFMTNDYVALENMFKGVSTTTGMKYGLAIISGTQNDVFGYVQYVLPNTSAEEKNIKRGMVFTEIDGQKMTVNNYQDLLARDSYSIDINYMENGKITPTGETVSLSKQEYSANPVLIAKTLVIDGKKIGYLMYTSFTADYDDELNAAFADFKADGVTDLILDLRYNGGGRVETAVDLSSMITGQFEGKVFMKEEWNEKYQNYFESEYPDRLVNLFNDEVNSGQKINSLNLSKVYVLTTNRSASASELVINGLDPYIDVIQVGKKTTGKFQASITLYDSENFGKDNANTNHTYAIQPLVLKSVNSAGVSDYVNGLDPDIEIGENLNNFGVLGEETEPLLEAAINNILGKAQDQEKAAMAKRTSEKFRTIGESDMDSPLYQKMYIDKLPADIKRGLKKE